MTLANHNHSRKAARLLRLQICRVFDPAAEPRVARPLRAAAPESEEGQVHRVSLHLRARVGLQLRGIVSWRYIFVCICELTLTLMFHCKCAL